MSKPNAKKKASFWMPPEDELALMNMPSFVRERKLRRGERVALAAAIPGIYLTGSDVRVMEYSDGSIVLANESLELGRLVDQITFLIVATADLPITGGKLRLLRQELGLTQEQLAARLELVRETVSRMENSSEPVPATVAMSVRYMALPRVRKLTKELGKKWQEFQTEALGDAWLEVPRFPLKKLRYNDRMTLTIQLPQ